MNIRRELWIKWFVFMLLLFAISMAVYGNNGIVGIDKDGPGKKNIVFVTKMKSGEYWDTVKMGATAAAKEFEVNVTFDGTDTEEDAAGQIRILDQAVENKADSVILAAASDEKLKDTVEKIYKKKIPLILVDTEVQTDKFDCIISSDNEEAGRQVGEQLIWLVGAKAKVLIISFDPRDNSAIRREAGLNEILNQHAGVAISATGRVPSNIEAAKVLVGRLLDENKDIDGIAALDATGSMAVAEVLTQRNLAGKVKLVAFDSTKEEIEMLDNGTIQSLVVQNPFTIGYISVKKAVERLNGESIEKHIHTKTTAIDGTSMYLQENQKLLFPFAN